MGEEQWLRRQPIPRSALLLDMNSFFAAAEQQVHPELRGRPVAVCPYNSDASCVLAASIEAKGYGIKTGMRVFEAKALCPGLVTTRDHPQLYRDIHDEIMRRLDQTRCKVLVKSIDEALLLVPNDLHSQTVELAHHLQKQIHQIGEYLSCSIGIASNLFLAKLASNILKPNGLVVIDPTPAELTKIYAQLQLEDLYGISRRLAGRLKSLGIHNPTDLYRAELHTLKNQLGINGQAWYLRLRGYEVDLKPTHKRSVGHQITIVPHPSDNISALLVVADQLATKVGRRLLNYNLAAKAVTIYVRFSDHTSWGATYRSQYPLGDANTLTKYAKHFFENLNPLKPVRLVSLTASSLVAQEHLNLDLFHYDKAEKLSRAVKLIEDRYGEAAILSAKLLKAGQMPDRIGFGRN